MITEQQGKKRSRCYYCEDLNEAQKGNITALMLITRCGNREHSYWCEKSAEGIK